MTTTQLIVDLLQMGVVGSDEKTVTLCVADTDVKYRLAVISNHEDKIVLRGYQVYSERR